MSAAYDAFIAAQNKAAIVLAEIQPAQQLGPWTKEGGFTNVYSCAFSQYAATDVVAGGLYRRLDQVRQNATALTSRASAALVDANLGSYFYDVTNSKIYVSMSDGTSPEVWAFVGAWFTIFFASSSVSFSDQPLYEPRIAKTLPTIESEKPDLLFGATVSDAGSIALSNADKLYDKLAKLWIWRNKLVTFKLGGTNLDNAVVLAYSDYATIGAMTINTAIPDDELFTLQLDAIGSILNQSIPPNTVTKQNFVDPSQTGGNVSLPWLIGTAKDCKLAITAELTSTDVIATVVDITFANFQDPSFQPATIFYAVNRTSGAKTTLREGTDYTTGVDGTVQFVGYDVNTYDFWMDGVWATAGFGGSARASTFGVIVTAILEALGVPASKIDATAFAALDAVSPTLGRYLTAPTQAVDEIRRLEQSINAQVYQRVDGVWTCRLFDPSAAVAFTLSDYDFATWSPEEDLSAALDQVRVQYDERQASGIYYEGSASDDAVKYGRETSDSTSLPTYLRNAADAQDRAAHDQFLKGSPPCRITAQMRGLTLMTAAVGDMVAITRARGPIARTGVLDGQVFEIVKLTKQLAGQNGIPVVTAVFEDLGGQTDRIARYTDGVSVPDWSSATATQRALYGWYCDGNGYIDSTDVTTKHAKVAI